MSTTTASSPAVEARFVAPGELTIATATAAYVELGALLDTAHGSLEVDLSATRRIDTAGVQLLLGAERRARGRGITVRWTDPDHRLADAITTLGLESVFATHGEDSPAGTPPPQHGEE